jgi:hypothetical protein
MFAYALASKPCSEATNIEALFSLRAVFGWIFKLNSAWERFDVVNITLHFFLKDIRPMLPPAMKHSIAVS